MSGIFGILKNPAGLRAVAVFEVAKGLAVLLLALGFFKLVHEGAAEDTARSLMLHLHISPSRRISGVMLEAINHATDAELWGIATAALAYFAVRSTEAWGLWFGKAWAQWFSLLSGAMYLPWEIVELVTRPTWIRASLVGGNTAIVLYMALLRLQDRHKPNTA